MTTNCYGTPQRALANYNLSKHLIEYGAGGFLPSTNQDRHRFPDLIYRWENKNYRTAFYWAVLCEGCGKEISTHLCTWRLITKDNYIYHMPFCGNKDCVTVSEL